MTTELTPHVHPAVLDAAIRLLKARCKPRLSLLSRFKRSDASWARFEDFPKLQQNAINLLVRAGLAEARARGHVTDTTGDAAFRFRVKVWGGWQRDVAIMPPIRERLSDAFRMNLDRRFVEVRTDNYEEVRLTGGGEIARQDCGSRAGRAAVAGEIARGSMGQFPAHVYVDRWEKVERATVHGQTIAAAQAIASPEINIQNVFNAPEQPAPVVNVSVATARNVAPKKRASKYDAQEAASLWDAWVRFRDAEGMKADFAADNNISETELERAFERDRKARPKRPR